MKKSVGVFLICIVMLLTNLLSVTVYSATTDQKAISAYKQKLKAIKKNDMRASDTISYKYIDLDGNGVRELICAYKHKKRIGSCSTTFRIYTYSKGKVVCQLNKLQCGYEELRYSRVSKAFRVLKGGHGGLTYEYFKLKKGKYVLVGSKNRSNSYYNTNSWSYYVGGKKVSKATYERNVGGTQKGVCQTYSLWNGWHSYR